MTNTPIFYPSLWGEAGVVLTLPCLFSSPTDLQKCGPGWDSFQGSCYKHFSTRRSWEDAELQCRHYGGHLANILTPEEQDFINSEWPSGGP